MSNDEQSGSIDAPTEQRRLEATALVASRVSREESQIASKKVRSDSVIRDVIIAVLLIAVAVLGFRTATESSRTTGTVNAVARHNCKLYRDIATIELIPSTTTVGLQLVADFRNLYYEIGCNSRGFGDLSRPDARLIPYLAPNAR